jgi:hypothetical protein
MSNDPNRTTSVSAPVSAEPSKPGLFARASALAVNNPVKSTIALSAATTGAIKAAGWGAEKVKGYFAEKSTEPAREQAAGLVSGVFRGFGKRFG